MADGELWHVRMSPDEVKELTLEQLDDLFRLDIIEADTLIWQPGMTEWLPLSVVAGLGDDDGEAVSIPVSAPPPAFARTQTSWPPKPVPPSRSAPPPLSQRPVPPSPSARPAPPPLSQRPAPLSQRPAPPLSSRPAPPPLSQRPAPPPPSSTATSWPPPSAWSNPPPRPASVSAFASTVAEPPRSVPPSSVAPVSFAPDPFAPAAAGPLTTMPAIRTRSQSSGGGSWVILLSLAAGAAVTLYRNDLVHGAMRSIGQEGAYVKLETALGGPSFGTPRAVQQMAAASAALTATSTLEAPAASPSLPSTSTVATTSSPATTTATSEPAPATPAPETKTAASASEPPKPTEAPHHDPPKAAAPAPRPAAHASAPETVDPVFKTPKKGKKGGKGSEYDPLNPSL